MFNGTSYHSLDSKGRVAIPVRFRDPSQEESSRLVVLNANAHLVVYPHALWEGIAGKLSQLSQFDPRVQAIRRYFIAGAADCECDRQGRILLPPASRQVLAAGELALVGMGSFFEIWNKDLWLAEQARVQENMAELGKTMAELGI